MTNDKTSEGNVLFPIFIKPDKLKILIVGGGAVGLEKVESLFRNSPEAKVKLVAPEIREEIILISKKHPSLELFFKPYDSLDLKNIDIVIAATCIRELNEQVYKEAKKERIICNVADTPELCDFYMCSIVQKGELKVGISTNGKSPTFAKRFREILEEILPDGIDSILKNLSSIRNALKGDFEYKVKKMEEITMVMKEKNKE